METERPDRQSRPIVAFDFDGTLTIRDSYTSFLKWRNGPLAYGLGLSALTPDLLAYTLHRDRGRLKAAATKRFLAGEIADLEMRPDGRLTGVFASPNCRAAEKVVRLREAYGPTVRLAAAYGDTSGDTEMLGLADHKGWREFTGRP